VNYKNGILNGTYKFYWENGELKVNGEYSNGLYKGKWNYFDYTGIKIGEGHFNNGNGIQIEYSLKTGKKIKETNIIKNKKNGLETWWDDSGKKIKENIYADDIITHSTLY
jgi:antitoxin component YwqK of YwqJK toxin-antitoxin module